MAAGPSDKARFYLEQSLEELNELERKKVFSREEITSISKKRSDFEHIINARGSTPDDYRRYIEFEHNLYTLREKRIKRLRVKHSTAGRQRIFSLYRRGTRKFPGDLGLWRQYIEFARKEKAYKKLTEIFTAVVRLHPTKAEVWIYAARYFMDTQADMTNARSYMQRGLRFCKSSQFLWLEYAKLETIYIGKIAGRRKILGLDVDRTKEPEQDNPDADMIALPTITAEDIDPNLGKEDGVDEDALENMASAPVLTGAIPIAIFDAAMKQFKGDAAFAAQFFRMFTEFPVMPCLRRILNHIIEHLEQLPARDSLIAGCKFVLPLVGVDPNSPDFPAALRQSFDEVDVALQKDPAGRAVLAARAVQQFVPLARACEDAGLKAALKASIRKYCRTLEEGASSTEQRSGDATVNVAKSLQEAGSVEDADYLLSLVAKQYSSNEGFMQLRALLET